MAGSGVQIKGLRELVRDLEQLGVEVADLKSAFQKVGQVIASEAQSLAPHVTGNLAGSIKASKTKNKAVVRAGRAKVPYAGVVNYGRYFPTTGTRLAGRKFINVAADNKRLEALRVLDDELGKLIRKASLK